MITTENTKYLLELPKIVSPHIHLLDLSITEHRLKLKSPQDEEWDFLLQIQKSSKAEHRISLHHQENNHPNGLMRVDFNSGHRNPMSLNEHVPDFLRPLVGGQINVSHIHFNVDGYPPLAWAIPLTGFEGFAVKEISAPGDLSSAVRAFAKLINLNINFTIRDTLL